MLSSAVWDGPEVCRHGFSSGLRDGLNWFSHQKASLNPSLGKGTTLCSSLEPVGLWFSMNAYAEVCASQRMKCGFMQKSSWLHSSVRMSRTLGLSSALTVYTALTSWSTSSGLLFSFHCESFVAVRRVMLGLRSLSGSVPLKLGS